MRRSSIIVLACLGACMAMRPARAGSISIPDNSYEGITASVFAPTAAGITIAGSKTNSFGQWTAIAGDTLTGVSPIGIAAGTATSLGGPTPLNGTYDVRISLGAGVGQYALITQSLSTLFQANSTYTLSLDVDAGANAPLLAHSSLELYAGSTMVDSLSGSSLVSLIDGNTGFQTISLNYTTGSTAPSGNIGLEFESDSVASLGGNVYLDNWALSVAAVPEPHAGMLLMAGFGALGFIFNFRKKAL